MEYLTDPTNNRMYEVCYEADVPNYGLKGGTNHVLIVRNAMEEPKWTEGKACSCNTSSPDSCSREPIATDGRIMGPIERKRCVSTVTAG